MSRGARVAIVLAEPVEQLVWALAADALAAVPAVLDPRWPGEQRRAALAEVDPAVLVGDHEAIPRRVAAGAALDIGPGWISFTSGSSGAPRAVWRTRESWASSFPAFTALSGVTAGERVLVPGSLSSSMCAFAVLHTLAAEATAVLLSRWEPGLVRDVSVLHLVPTMLHDLLDAEPDLRPRLFVSAGAKLDTALERRAGARWPGARVVEYYGSSEQSFVTARVGGDPATVGNPFPGVRVQVRSESGACQVGTPGVIWASSPFAAEGYLGDSPGRFRRDGGWVSVGDNGVLDRAGVLTLLGRETITTGGTTVQPAAVEAVLRELSGVRDAVVVGVAHPRLGAIVAAIVECGPEVTLPALRAHARGRLAPAQRPRRWYTVRQLPRSAAGKPARAELLTAIGPGLLPAMRR